MTDPVIHPKFHHVNLKTTRLQEMIDFYRDARRSRGGLPGPGRRLAVERRRQPPDRAARVPELRRRPRQGHRTGMHHSAFEYASFDELNSSYLRLKEAGITPALCLDHGMTLSYYYADPDGNNVELQVDSFGAWEKSKEWMQTSMSSRPTRSACSSIRTGSRPITPTASASRRSTPRRWPAATRPSRRRSRSRRWRDEALPL